MRQLKSDPVFLCGKDEEMGVLFPELYERCVIDHRLGGETKKKPRKYGGRLLVIIRPFKAVRPRPDVAEKVAALPYDVMSSQEAREMVRENPYSFLHVDKAEIDLEEGVNLYDERVYLKARENLQKMMSGGIFLQDQKPQLYLYRQDVGERKQTGIVACVSIDDYLSQKIKKHEHTRPEKEVDRTRHIKYCNAQTGPIFLTYPAQEKIDHLVSSWEHESQPVYDFTSGDGIRHRVWILNHQGLMQDIIQAFSRIESLYIADGHHRSASAVRIGLECRAENPDFTGDEEFNYFLAVIFPNHQLKILDYNRLVKDLNGLSPGDFLDKVREGFMVTEWTLPGPCHPQAPKHFGMYLEGKWYQLQARPGSYDQQDPVGRLDVSILQDNLLKPVLGIHDPRTDQRIDFVGGIRGLKELEKRVAADMTVAFSLYPTGIDDLMAIADAGTVMPPKSTWFEPKLRSGLFIHMLK